MLTGFSVWHLLLSFQIGQINVHQVIYRCTSHCQLNHGALGFKQQKRVNLASPSINQLLQVSLMVQPFLPVATGTCWAERSCPGHLRVLYCPWGYRDPGWCYSCMKVCAKPLRLVVFWGKKDVPGRSNVVAKTLLHHLELLHSSVTAALGVWIVVFEPGFCPHLRAGDSDHQSFNRIRKNLKHHFRFREQDLVSLGKYTLPLLQKLFPKT